MPKTDLALAGGEYAPVADRITLFYERFPEGRIITELVARDEREVTFRAAVYRSASDCEPAATGWAAEREGDGDINTVACLENTETSAIGRALANLGFTASAQRPSAEEMAKVSRARARLARRGVDARESGLRVAEPAGVTYGASARANKNTAAASSDDGLLRADIHFLLESAERAGVTPARLASARQTLERSGATRTELERLERGVRAWLSRRDAEQSLGADGRSLEAVPRHDGVAAAAVPEKDVRGDALQG